MNYWKGCISEAFEDAGITATDEQIETVSDWVGGSHENYGMSTGQDCIPNPMSTEVEKLKAEIKNLRESHDIQLYGIRSGVAKRRNVSTNQVHIEEDGNVTYDLI